jgi:hypothetical protein
MWITVAAIAAFSALASWLAGRFRTRPSDPNAQQPGERWMLVDKRNTPDGNVRLMLSENHRGWGVQSVPAEEGRQSTMTWYTTEANARVAFAGDVAANENHR